MDRSLHEGCVLCSSRIGWGYDENPPANLPPTACTLATPKNEEAHDYFVLEFWPQTLGRSFDADEMVHFLPTTGCSPITKPSTSQT